MSSTHKFRPKTVLTIVAVSLAWGCGITHAEDAQDRIANVHRTLEDADTAMRLKKPVADVEKILAQAQREYAQLPVPSGEVLINQTNQLKYGLEYSQRELAGLRKLAQANQGQTILAWLQSVADGKADAKQLTLVATLTQKDSATRYELFNGKIRPVRVRKNSEVIEPIDPRLAPELLAKIARLAGETRAVKIASGVKDVPKDEGIPAKPEETTFHIAVMLPGVAVYESATYSYSDAKEKRPDMYALMQAILEAAETKPDN